MVKERQLLRGGRKQAPIYPYESLIPDATATRDVGSSARQYRNAYIESTGFVDVCHVDAELRIPRGTTLSPSGLGTFWVKEGAKPYVIFYVSGAAAHTWASSVLRTGAKSW